MNLGAINLYIYIYIYRERERERESGGVDVQVFRNIYISDRNDKW